MSDEGAEIADGNMSFMPVLHDRDTMTVREGRTTSRWKPRRMSERTMCFHPVWDRNGVHLGDTRLRWRSVGPEVSTQTWVLSGSQRRLQRRQRSTTPADDGDCRESWFVLQPILHRWLCRLQLYIDHKMERAPINVGGLNPTALVSHSKPIKLTCAHVLEP